MNVTDIVIVVLVALSAITGYQSGLIRSIASLVGLILGFSIASWNYGSVAARLWPHMGEPMGSILAFFLVFVLVTLVVGLIGHILRKIISAIGLGWLDRLAGLFFGAISGLVLVTILIALLVAFYPTSSWLEGSNLAGRFLGSVHLTISVTPDELKSKITEGLNRLENDSPAWLHPK